MLLYFGKKETVHAYDSPISKAFTQIISFFINFVHEHKIVNATNICVNAIMRWLDLRMYNQIDNIMWRIQVGVRKNTLSIIYIKFSGTMYILRILQSSSIHLYAAYHMAWNYIQYNIGNINKANQMPCVSVGKCISYGEYIGICVKVAGAVR